MGEYHGPPEDGAQRDLGDLGRHFQEESWNPEIALQNMYVHVGTAHNIVKFSSATSGLVFEVNSF